MSKACKLCFEVLRKRRVFTSRKKRNRKNKTKPKNEKLKINMWIKVKIKEFPRYLVHVTVKTDPSGEYIVTISLLVVLWLTGYLFLLECCYFEIHFFAYNFVCLQRRLLYPIEQQRNIFFFFETVLTWSCSDELSYVAFTLWHRTILFHFLSWGSGPRHKMLILKPWKTGILISREK